jgi:hypothetical protein
MIKMYIGLHVEYPLFLSDFSGTKIFLTNFRTNIQYKIPWTSVQWESSCSMRTGGQTDRRDEANSQKEMLWMRLKLSEITKFFTSMRSFQMKLD